MIGWSFVAFLLAVGLILFRFKMKGKNWFDWSISKVVISAIAMVALFTICLDLVCAPFGFAHFETKYNLQKETFSAIQNEDNFIYSASIIEINNELFDRQASRKQFGLWSFNPARVLNMTPIGMEK